GLYDSSLVFLQLLFTFCVVCIFTFSSTVKELVQSSIWVYVSAYIVFAVVVVPLSLCTSLSRRHPWNLIALVVVTVSLSYMVGTIASYHDTMTVIMAMGATLTISLGIIAFATQSRYDFTLCYVLLLILGLDLLMFMMTGSMSHRVSPEDYVTAALIIYLDIVLIFLYLLGRR
uniref:Uncharacterized protein n=1 Tax=Periophthalmus magnuspinnatus TaxID=409849 RepID=A0A3B3ZG84_9GOBI